MTRRSIKGDEDITVAIVRAVSEATGRDPTSLEPLAESVDPDAVNALFSRDEPDGTRSLTISYEGCRVTLTSDAVTVEPFVDA